MLADKPRKNDTKINFFIIDMPFHYSLWRNPSQNYPTQSAKPRDRAGRIRRSYSRSTVTGASPKKPSARAAAGVMSIMRPRTKGPRSLTVTKTDRPLLRLVTRTFNPNGKDLWAAVKAPRFNLAPLAVRDPLSVE
jgi:hypothetical protein